MEQTFYALADLLAASVAAISGAQAARHQRLDLFGVYTVAYATACTGGIFRDVAIGAMPPVGLADWRYLACAIVAGSIVFWGGALLDRLGNSVLVFDAIGLGFYSVIGAQKALVYQANPGMAVLLGVATAVGGGVARDVLLNRVPAIMHTEIYALAALVGASIQVLGELMGWSLFVTPWFAASIAIAVRLLSLRYGWHLPTARVFQVSRFWHGGCSDPLRIVTGLRGVHVLTGRAAGEGPRPARGRRRRHPRPAGRGAGAGRMRDHAGR